MDLELTPPDPSSFPVRSATELHDDDQLADLFGIALDAYRQGFVQVSMTVRPDMINTHGVCHGGILFHLADTAMSYVSNADRTANLAQGATIDYLAPAMNGDVLTATIDTTVPGRSSVHDATIVNQQGEVVAAFRGRTRQLRSESRP